MKKNNKKKKKEKNGTSQQTLPSWVMLRKPGQITRRTPLELNTLPPPVHDTAEQPPGGETSPRPPATGHSRARLPHLCHQPQRSEEKVTTLSNFSRGWSGTARTLLGNAHTRASPAALTGQPGCVSIPVVGAFIAGAVPTNSRDANEPPPMAFGCRSKTVFQRGHVCVRPPATLLPCRRTICWRAGTKACLGDGMTTYGARSVTWPQQQASSLKRSRGVSLKSAKAVGTFSSITSTLDSPSSRMCASSRST